MNLRRKLLTTFGALAFLGLVIAGVSLWATLQWEASNESLKDHYERSLQAQRIRATTFEAFKEIPDALGENDPDAREEFEDTIKPVERDFEVWASLADTKEERRQVRAVREDYETLLRDAREFFGLLESGRREEAAELADGKIEEADFENFVASTERAVASDRAVRDEVRKRVEDARRTAQLVLVISSFGTVSLMLLLAAYLASDLFRPLREIEEALEDLEKGDLDRRLPEERADELGAINRAFNRAVESFSRRERIESLALTSAAAQGGVAEGTPNGDGPDWRSAPSRVTLHRLVSQLRSRVARLNDGEASDGQEEQRELVGELDRLSQAVARVTEFGFPLDLNLSRTDIRALLYRVFMRFQDEFAERAVSLELQIAPEVDHAVVDRLKLREALAELLRNALNALPERGGRLGLRARISEDGTELIIEVADEGEGAEGPLIDELFDEGGRTDRPRVGLAMTKAIIEQHGGQLEIDTEPGQGTYVQAALPLRR